MPVATASPAAKRVAIPPAAPDQDLILETVAQVEERVPAVRGKMRTWIHRADCGDATFALLKLAIVRIGVRTLLSRTHLNSFFEAFRNAPPRPSNNPDVGRYKRAPGKKRGR